MGIVFNFLGTHSDSRTFTSSIHKPENINLIEPNLFLKRYRFSHSEYSVRCFFSSQRFCVYQFITIITNLYVLDYCFETCTNNNGYNTTISTHEHIVHILAEKKQNQHCWMAIDIRYHKQPKAVS